MLKMTVHEAGMHVSIGMQYLECKQQDMLVGELEHYRVTISGVSQSSRSTNLYLRCCIIILYDDGLIV